MYTHHLVALAVLGCLGCAPLAAQPQTAAGGSLAACRSMGDAAARLACYDALPLGTVAATSAAPITATTPPRPVGASAVPLSAAPAPATATATAAPAPAAPSFGIDRAGQGEVQQITSSVAGLFEGWGPTSRIRLTNGQVWQVTDGSSAPLSLQSPRVTVKRALLGGYVMEFEGSNRTARVRRVE